MMFKKLGLCGGIVGILALGTGVNANAAVNESLSIEGYEQLNLTDDSYDVTRTTARITVSTALLRTPGGVDLGNLAAGTQVSRIGSPSNGYVQVYVRTGGNAGRIGWVLASRVR